MVREPKEGTLYRKGIRSPGKSRTFEIPRTTDDSNWPRTPAVLEFEYVVYLVGIRRAPQSEGQGAVARMGYAFILRELLLGGCVQATKDPLD
jgi:hypothetical protein